MGIMDWNPLQLVAGLIFTVFNFVLVIVVVLIIFHLPGYMSRQEGRSQEMVNLLRRGASNPGTAPSPKLGTHESISAALQHEREREQRLKDKKARRSQALK